MITYYDEPRNQLHIDYAVQSDIDALDYPPNLEEIRLLGDYVQHFAPPAVSNFLDCSRVGLRTLVVPDGVKTLWCEDNYLEELILPPSIQYVRANTNLIHTLRPADPDVGLPNLRELYVVANRITRFDFPAPKSLYHFEICDQFPGLVLPPDWKAAFDKTKEDFYI